MKYFDWTGTATGLHMKAMVYVLAARGTRGRDLRDAFSRHCPWGADEYLRVTGNPLTAQVLMGRWYNMVSDRTLSEHPRNNPQLQAFVRAIRLTIGD